MVPSMMAAGTISFFWFLDSCFFHLLPSSGTARLVNDDSLLKIGAVLN